MSDNPTSSSASDKPKLLDRVRAAIRVRHYSRRTEQVYTDWIKRFILFHDKRHPEEMGEAEVSAFLTPLAADKNVAGEYAESGVQYAATEDGVSGGVGVIFDGNCGAVRGAVGIVAMFVALFPPRPGEASPPRPACGSPRPTEVGACFR